MARYFSLLILLVLCRPAWAIDAYSIMKAWDERDTGNSSEGVSKMILIDKKDRQRVRDMKQFSLDQDGIDKSIIFFLEPSDVKGTAYLSYDYDDDSQDDDSWLYLPALKKVNRVAASDKSGSFMGSDFTYSDINGTNIEWYDYTIIKDSDMVDGAECWVIESTPKPEFADKVSEETGYAKSQLWIRKDNYVQVQAKIWEEKQDRIKYFSAKDVKLIDGIWTATKLQMIATRNGQKQHASVIDISDIKYNTDVSSDMFTTQAMERGI